MKAKVTVITLGVENLELSFDFYKNGLGFQSDGIIGKEFAFGAVAFFDLQPHLKLALWPRESLAHDTGLDNSTKSPLEISLGHNVNSREEVDTVMQDASKAGANIIKPPHETFWGGYSGYFQDPDGHLWEVVWNPAWQTE